MARTTKNQATTKTLATIEVGFWAALALREGSAPLRCYVGQVQAVDENGVRITLIDWMTGEASGFDFFAPWSDISSALIGTPAHHLASFGEDAGTFQSKMKGLNQQPPSVEDEGVK